MAKADKAPKAKKDATAKERDIRKWAIQINDAPAATDLKIALQAVNVPAEAADKMTNGAGIALALYQAAIGGDLKAIEKWEKYIAEEQKPKNFL